MPTLTRSKPTLEVSVDFAANPTASYGDIHTTDDGAVSFWRCNSVSTFLDDLSTNDGVMVSTPALTTTPFPYVTVVPTRFCDNRDFEVAATGWSSLGSSTVARSTARAHTGTASLLITATASAAQSATQFTLVGEATAFATQYRLSCWIYGEPAMSGKQVVVSLREQGGAVASENLAATTFFIQQGWFQYTVEGAIHQVDRTNVDIQIGASSGSGWINGDFIYLDDVSVECTDFATTFDGVNDSAYVLESISLTGSGAQSIDGWVKFASIPGSTKDIVTKPGCWYLQVNSAGKLLWTVKNDANTATVTSNTALLTNTWYYVAGVYDGASAILYINGVPDNSAAYTSGIEVSGQQIRFAGASYTTAAAWQSSQTATGNATTVTCNAPVSIASGDLLVAHFCHRNSLAWTPPSGWILWSLETPATGAPQTSSQVWYKIATGSEPANYTWTGDVSGAYAIAISRITGQNTEVPFSNPAYSTVQTSNTVTHATGSHIGNVNNVLILGMFSSRGGGTFTESSGTERYDFTSGDVVVAMSSQTQATPSSLNITGTSSVSTIGAAHFIAITGSGIDETAVSLDDWTYWSRALDADDVARNYFSKDSGTPSWTNVTTEVRHMEASLPERRNELDMLVNGKMSMTLREVNDKDFDPTNTSSPYLPDIEQRVRVRATWNSTTYNVFRGYADRWTPVRLGGDQDEVAFEASDGFDLLALAPISGTVGTGYSGSHIDAILSKALWPLSDRSIDPGQYVMNGYTISEGTFGLSLLQEIAASERGIFFIDAAGVATFHDAAHRGSQTRSTTSQATFSDYPSPGGNLTASTEIRYQDIQPTRDKDKIINIWTVTPDSGVFGAAAQTVIDHDSVARYGPRGSSKSTRLATNSDAADQAGNLLTETAFPADRYEYMKVIPLTTESYDKCLDLKISDRITVKRGQNPGYDGAAVTRDYFVEGKSINVINKNSAWEFTFVLTPVSSGNYYQTIMRDSPVSYWRMDSLT